MTIKLKLSDQKIRLMPDLLMNYMDFLSGQLLSCEDNYNLVFQQMSICTKLHEKFNKKAISRHLAKKSTIKLELYEALVVNHAMLIHIDKSENDYTKSIARTIHFNIDEQLPTKLQLTTQI